MKAILLSLALLGGGVEYVLAQTNTVAATPNGCCYTNTVVDIREGPIPVTDPDGKPVSIHTTWHNKIDQGDLKIIWTWTNNYGWNFTTNAAAKKDGMPGPSIPVFMESALGAKSLRWVAVPRTPFRVAVVDGKFFPILEDTERAVLLRLNGLEKVFADSNVINVSEGKAELVQEGGDCAFYTTVIFSRQSRAIVIHYFERYDGF